MCDYCQCVSPNPKQLFCLMTESVYAGVQWYKYMSNMEVTTHPLHTASNIEDLMLST